ncbi:hypothetical protein GIW79_23520 [Pseudomonas sp. PA-7-1E]|nr:MULTISPECIES: hypothetical protein [Pseudomonas]MBA1300782.1 hypothetical protein [Pseudomonas carnis]MBC6623819.1 hypothetical protein [Pseudomonas sp.]MBJ2202077.1 hypothetical protein [Pseudomonas carnis]MBJ2304010.1 hypothetical protein [Pseudomonas sp. MF2846]MBK3492125.1 hypothetical protein [Pseudomonas sp. MF2857]
MCSIANAVERVPQCKWPGHCSEVSSTIGLVTARQHGRAIKPVVLEQS